MAVKGKGAKIWLHDGTALTKLPELLSVTPPSPTRDTIDTTHHESSGDYREFISSLIDAGEATALVHYVPGGAGDTLLNEAFADGDLRGFAIDVNSATATQQRIAGSVLVTGYEKADVVIDDKMTATLTLKVSGPLTQGATPAP
jgi:predicted secreted protein